MVERPPMNEAHLQEFARSLYGTVASLRRLAERPNEELDLTQSEVEILYYVKRNPGCSISEIARVRQLRTPNVSSTVRLLTKQGFIRRTDSTTDRRCQQLYLTETGLECISRIFDYWAEIVGGIVERMKPDDVMALRGYSDAFEKLWHAAHEYASDTGS
ncbi:MarR family winged helix-turn-helix transcriptional regulator [Corynebacterium freiburgense]|uniref:MarR family winged helix-turn-helix transcriptional regulator n=1 Tax=Corynebacterium freiburgense TaxID=556548 RepID=UPI0003FEF625|nr:MarR family transcriptional regulator [Corynebacterium freiburgense]WJZ03730.1 transcriptional regulator SlyA [Corynebacterium freiburgense]